MADQEFKFCTKCGAKMPKEAKFCTACGNPFRIQEADVQAQQPSPQMTQEQKPQENNVASVETQTSHIVSNIQPSAKKSNMAPIFIGIGAVVVVIIAVILFLTGKKEIEYDISKYFEYTPEEVDQFIEDADLEESDAMDLMTEEELSGYKLLSNDYIDVVVDDKGVIGSVTVRDGDYNFAGVGLGDSFNDFDKVTALTDNGYTSDGSYGTVEMFTNGDVSVTFSVDNTIDKIQAMVIYSDNNIDNDLDASNSEADFENESTNISKIRIADIFVPWSEAVSWSLSENNSTYYMIPMASDDSNIIYFNASNELKGYAEVYYMDVESIGETDHGGLTAIGTMYSNTNSPVYNGVFEVTWDSLESIDWATVEAVDGTEMTDLSMVGEYYYYGLVKDEDEVVSADNSEYIFPDTDSRYLTQSDVAGMDAATIRLAINEIYARHGRAFETEDLNEYFSSKSWYTPIYSQEEFAAIENSVFNEYEKKNIEFLAAIRDSLSAQTVSFTPNWIYGTYQQDLGGRGGISMEIGYTTDEYSSDYIILSGSYEDSTGYYEGYVVQSDGNNFVAADEMNNIVYFSYNGIDEINITSADNTGGMYFPGFTGVYKKTSEFSGS